MTRSANRQSSTTAAAHESIILFDGVCNLCHASVQFVLKRDTGKRFKFAALQSDVGQALLRQHAVPTSGLTSMVLVTGGRAYRKSTAALRIAARLDGPWPLLFALILVPRPLRDAIYDFVGNRRYRWFGKTACGLTRPPGLSDRFLT